MCGRLTLKTPPSQWTQLLLPVLDSEPQWSSWQPRYNIAPTQQVVVIAQRMDDAAEREPHGTAPQPHFAMHRWGLVPSWASDLSIGSRMINARRETLREKKSFIGPLRKRRCVIVADGYYEWQRAASVKQPFWLGASHGGLLQLAGLWEVNTRATGAPLLTCTIITTEANPNVSEIHDRMPVVLNTETAARWLSAECDAESAFGLLEPAAAVADLRYRAVSSYVNNARHEGPQCLADPAVA
jgi:putative SOS response-associated peptidase YedK